MLFNFSKEDDGKEFSIKFLPNIDAMENSTISIEKFYVNGQLSDKLTFIKNQDNGNRINLNFSFALVNKEYRILKYGNIFTKLINLYRLGSFYKVNGKYISCDEFENLHTNGNGKIFLEKDEYEFIDLEGPKNLFDIKESLSLKFKVVFKHGFISFENLRVEEDKENLLWDGTEEGKTKVQEFLKNKTEKLVDAAR